MYAIVSLRTQYTNLGDLLINVILVSRLAEHCKVICDAADVPAAYLAEFSEELRSGGVLADVVASRSALGLRLVRHLAGGAGVAFLLSPGDNLPSRSLQRLVIGILARLVPGLCIAQVGASYPALSWLDRFLLRSGTKRPGLLSVRDEASRDRLRSAGVAAALVPDLAFLQPLSLESAARCGADRFLMTFRERAGVPFEQLVSRLRPLIAEARSAGLIPEFCWQVAGDEAYARRLAAACGTEVFEYGAGRPEAGRPSLEQMRQTYRRSAVICSNRLHGLLLGAANGALPLALLSAEDKKVSAAFAATSMDRFVTVEPASDAAVLQWLLQTPEAGRYALQQAFAGASELLDGYFRTVTTIG